MTESRRNQLFSICLGAGLGVLVASHISIRIGIPVLLWEFLFMAAAAGLAAYLPIRCVVESRLGPDFARLPRSDQRRLGLASLFICVALMIVGPTLPRILWEEVASNQELTRLLPLFVGGIAGQLIFGAWLIGAILFWLLSIRVDALEPPRIPRLAVLNYALPCIAVWSICHLGLWPAIMNADSGDQWEQIHSLHFDDWHPAFLAFTFWLISKVCDSPAAVVLVQTVALACSFGWGLVLLRRAGVSERVTWVLACLIAVSPLSFMWVNCIAKDTPFSIVMLWMALLVFEAVLTRGDSLARPSRLVALVLLLPPVMLFRHNGLAPAILTLAGLMFAYRKQAWRIGLVAACALAIFGGVRLVLYPALDVRPTMIRMQPVIHLLAAHVQAGTPLSSRENAILSRVHRLDDQWRYDPFRGDTTMFDRSFKFSKFTPYPPELPSIAWSLTLKNPRTTLRHFVWSTSYIWRMEPPATELDFVQTFILWDDTSRLRYMDTGPPMIEEPLVPYITHALWHNLRILRENELVRMLWSPAFMIYALVACVVIWCVRVGEWRGLLLLVPAISNELAIAVGAGGEVAFRFHLPAYFSAVLFCGLLFARNAIHPDPK